MDEIVPGSRAHTMIKHLHGTRGLAYRANDRLKGALSSMKENISRKKSVGAHAVEVVAGAAVGGLVQGRLGPDGPHILGMPAEAVVGAALILGGTLTDVAGRISEDVAYFGTGLFAAWISGAAYGVGKHWHDTGHLSLTSKPPAGAGLPPTSASGLGPDQLSQMAQMMGPR